MRIERMLKLRSLLTDRSGNYAIAFSMVFTVLVAAGGFGIDLTRALSQKSDLQNAMDAALLGAMAQKHTDSEQISYAKDLFVANLAAANARPFLTNIYKDEEGRLVGEAKARIATSLLPIVGVNEVDLSINSAVIRGPQTGNPLCIMAMHPYRKHTLELKGSVSLYGTKCHIYGNSNHTDDVVDPHTPQNFITAASVTAVGYGHHFIENVKPPLEGSVMVVPDPFLHMKLPYFGSCDQNRYKIKGKTVTLDPGTYCDGLSISGNSKVTLNPGLYVIQGNDLDIQDSVVTGDGVTLFFADRRAEFSVEDSVVRLVAPSSGPWKSFVALAKRDENSWTFENSTLDMYGIVYAPNSSVDWVNKGTPEITAQWTAWILDGFSWSGSGVINFPYETEGAAVPHPASLNVIPRPSLSQVVRLVR